jgi:hypothetical protein
MDARCATHWIAVTPARTQARQLELFSADILLRIDRLYRGCAYIRHAVELHVISPSVAVSFVVGVLHIRVAVDDQIFPTGAIIHIVERTEGASRKAFSAGMGGEAFLGMSS